MKRVLFAVTTLFAAVSVAIAADVNKATAAELDAIKGIGPAMSKKIIDERAKGSFKDWADFDLRVKGIGEKSSVKLSTAGLTVNGQALSNAPAAPAKAMKPAAAVSAVKETPKTATAPAAAAVVDAATAKAEAKKAKAEEKKAAKEAKAAAKAEAKLNVATKP